MFPLFTGFLFFHFCYNGESGVVLSTLAVVAHVVSCQWFHIPSQLRSKSHILNQISLTTALLVSL